MRGRLIEVCELVLVEAEVEACSCDELNSFIVSDDKAFGSVVASNQDVTHTHYEARFLKLEGRLTTIAH